METVNVTDNATFARVKLGDIRPNRFRNLERWPLEQEVLDKLKQSIGETGFWSNLQAIENERGEIELRFGHHRLAAGLELFGPEYEVAIEIVPYRGEWNLQKALKFENAIGRNKVAHSNEVVYQTMHWWDDGVFEEFPTWYDCINNVEQAQYLLSLSELEHYFGKQNENGPGHYAQCVKYGIGETVLSKMLGDAVSLTEIRESLTSQEVTARRKRGMELKAAEERAKAEAERAEAERIKAKQEMERRKAEQEAKERQAELDRIAAEQRRLEAEARQAKEAEQHQRLVEEANQQARDLEAKKAASQELHERALREHKERQKTVVEKETKARQADIKATQKEQALERREWYDARASEVFGNIPAHGQAFRQAVSHEGVRPYLETESLVPFAKAIKAKYGDEVTAEKIRQEVNENFREFRKTLMLKEKEIRDEKEKDNPLSSVIDLIQQAVTDGNRFSKSLAKLIQVMENNKITGVQGLYTGDFKDVLSRVSTHIKFFN